MYSTAVVNTELSRNFNGEVTLDELAERVREAHAATQTIVANALAAIFAAGEALIAARARIAEGGWQHCLRTCCSIPLSTAKLYVQITEHRAEIEAALKKDPCLSLRAARLLIAKPKSPPEPSTKTDDQQQPVKRPRARPHSPCVVCGALTKIGNHHCAQCIERGFGPCEACEGISLPDVEEDAS